MAREGRPRRRRYRDIVLDGVRDILGSEEEEVAAAADVVVDGEEEIVESKASGDRKRQSATLS